MLSIILISIILILILSLIFCIGVIRGFLKIEKKNGEIKPLTGKEIEVIRRRLISVGIQSITATEVFCLIKTIRDTSLGLWVDTDVYFPADPYEDIDSNV